MILINLKFISRINFISRIVIIISLPTDVDKTMEIKNHSSSQHFKKKKRQLFEHYFRISEANVCSNM